MVNEVRAYFEILQRLFAEIMATGPRGEFFSFEEAMQRAIREISRTAALGGKLFFIGNGASAAIASHMAADFSKNAGIRAMSFNDSALLTCVGNDCGYQHVFEKPIEVFAQQGDILVAISSSGQSENILRAVAAARRKDMKVITLSGFAQDNPLRRSGDMNFYVPYPEYGPVEAVHLSLCHCWVDLIIKSKHGAAL